MSDKAIYKEVWSRDGVKRVTKDWYCRFTDENGKYRKVATGCADRKGAQLVYLAELKKIEERKHAKLVGLPIPSAIDENIPALIEQWKREKLALGKNKLHVARFVARMTYMTKGFSSLSQITAEKVTNILMRLEETPEHLVNKRGRKITKLTPQTINMYRLAIYTLFQWLVRSDRWPRNPIVAVARRIENDPAIDRRALVGDELKRLLTSTGEVSPRRAAIYLVAVNTGLRRSELAKLKNRDLDFTGERGIVTVRRANAKNRKQRHIPLSVAVTKELRDAGIGKGDPDALVFPPGTQGVKEGGIPQMETFRNDLKRAGIEYVTSEGKIDVHALRTTFATDLVRAGVPLPKAQKLLGHSTPMLTMKFYTKLGLADFDKDTDALDAYRERAAAVAEKPKPVTLAKAPQGPLSLAKVG